MLRDAPECSGNSVDALRTLNDAPGMFGRHVHRFNLSSQSTARTTVVLLRFGWACDSESPVEVEWMQLMSNCDC